VPAAQLSNHGPQHAFGLSDAHPTAPAHEPAAPNIRWLQRPWALHVAIAARLDGRPDVCGPWVVGRHKRSQEEEDCAGESNEVAALFRCGKSAGALTARLPLGMRHVQEKEDQVRWQATGLHTLQQLQDGLRLYAGGKEAESPQGVSSPSLPYIHTHTHVGQRLTIRKRAKYIEGLENRLGRMEHLLRLSGMAGAPYSSSRRWPVPPPDGVSY
jgi:hypothetical protein